ncbi:MAG: mucoidy inhibitor MuiA family protein [Candidatus Omnitrophica bacterium]|nr:mucoidy inhibitor MuiA family protein [Candidatus Omnitrophota bacterium]MDD5664698.1 mucoidy inhibitor MuiA family protein [Candidatus Omnitrophota bacterium]
MPGIKDKFIISVIFSLVLPFFVYAQDIQADSKISAVTIYSGDALIKRVAQVKLPQGENRVIFADLIPEIDENSLRVSAEGSASVKILGAYIKKEFLKEQPVDKVRAIQAQILRLEDEVRKFNDAKKRLADEKSFLDSIRLFSKEQLPKDLATKMPAIKDLSDMLTFLDSKLKDNYAQVVDSELNIRDLRKQIEVLHRQLAEISAPTQKMKRSIVVELDVLKAGSLNIDISYRVGGAYWYPLYDARVNFDKKETEFVSFASVKQNTGEDWQDVQISLSTAKVNVSGVLPEIEPWFLRPYQPRKQTRVGSAVLSQKMDLERNFLAAGQQMEPYFTEEPAAAIPAEYDYAQQEDKGISLVYRIQRLASVKSGGEEYRLAVLSQVLTSSFIYSAYPRLSTFAYLGSRVTNAKDLQLLGGRVNVFLDGDFVGVSQVKNIAPSEEFDLYLGVDENVKVKRELLEKKVDETLFAGIPATIKKTIYRYKVTVENYKSKDIKAKIFEAIPVSADDRIKVKVDKISLEPSLKDYKDKKGIWVWEFDLKPTEKKEIFYNYIIEHPRDMEIEGL